MRHTIDIKMHNTPRHTYSARYYLESIGAGFAAMTFVAFIALVVRF